METTVYRQGQSIYVGIGSDAASKAIRITLKSTMLDADGTQRMVQASIPTFEILAASYQPAAITDTLDRLAYKLSGSKFQGINAFMSAANAAFELNAVVQEALRRAREMDPAVRMATL